MAEVLYLVIGFEARDPLVVKVNGVFYNLRILDLLNLEIVLPCFSYM